MALLALLGVDHAARPVGAPLPLADENISDDVTQQFLTHRKSKLLILLIILISG